MSDSNHPRLLTNPSPPFQHWNSCLSSQSESFLHQLGETPFIPSKDPTLACPSVGYPTPVETSPVFMQLDNFTQPLYVNTQNPDSPFGSASEPTTFSFPPTTPGSIQSYTTDTLPDDLESSIPIPKISDDLPDLGHINDLDPQSSNVKEELRNKIRRRRIDSGLEVDVFTKKEKEKPQVNISQKVPQIAYFFLISN